MMLIYFQNIIVNKIQKMRLDYSKVTLSCTSNKIILKILKKYLQSEFSLNIKRNLVDFHLNLFKAEKNPVINVLEFYLLIQIRNYFRSFFFLILYKWEGRVRTLSTTNCNNKLKIKINSIICTVHYLKHCC
jgi:hypothetical protein